MVSRAAQQPHQSLLSIIFTKINVMDVYIRLLHSAQYPAKAAIRMAAMNTLVSSDDGRIMRLINKLAYCLAATIPVAILAGCSGASSSGGGGPIESSSIVIDAVPTADAAGLYIAEDEGFFAKQGLTVKIAPINGGEYGMGDLQTGKAQLVEGNYVSFILAQIAGKFAAPDPNNPTGRPRPVKPIDMRIIADSSQMQPGNQALYVMPDSKLKTVAEVVKAHATVGVNSLHNIGSVLLGSLLTANNDGVNSVTQMPEPLPEMPLLLSKHAIETAWLPEPFGTEAQEKYGAVQLADFDSGSLQNFPIGTIVGSEQWVKDNPGTIAAFLRAYDQGQQIADTDRSEVEKVLVKYTEVSQLVAANMTLDTYPLAMDVPVMQRVPDAMFQFGVLGAHYNITDMIQSEPGEVGGQ
jgi:NitT/TauT family transport system substrate-binding protein